MMLLGCGPSGGGGFSPSSISNLALWLDAAALSGAHNAAVAQWDDLSGNSYHATQGTAGARPTIKTDILAGKKVVAFDGGDSLATPLFWSTGPMSCVWLANKPAPNAANAGAYFSVGTAANGMMLGGAAETEQIFLSNVYAGNGGAITNTHTIRSFSNAAAAVPRNQFWVGGLRRTLPGLVNSAPIDATGGGLIGARGGLTNLLLGNIAEILWYNKLLSRAERVQCERYLSTKWGISYTEQIMLACDGDSITLGLWSSENATGANSYPSQLEVLAGSGYTSQNFGVGSQTIAQMTADAVAQIDTPHAGNTSTSILIQNGGVNDIFNKCNLGASAATAAAETIADWESYVTARKAAGWQVVSIPIIKIGAGYWTANMETARLAVNTHIRASSLWDALADLDARSEFSDPNNGTYYQTDKVHPTTAGNAVFASVVKTAVDTLFA